MADDYRAISLLIGNDSGIDPCVGGLLELGLCLLGHDPDCAI